MHHRPAFCSMFVVHFAKYHHHKQKICHNSFPSEICNTDPRLPKIVDHRAEVWQQLDAFFRSQAIIGNIKSDDVNLQNVPESCNLFSYLACFCTKIIITIFVFFFQIASPYDTDLEYQFWFSRYYIFVSLAVQRLNSGNHKTCSLSKISLLKSWLQNNFFSIINCF